MVCTCYSIFNVQNPIILLFSYVINTINDLYLFYILCKSAVLDYWRFIVLTFAFVLLSQNKQAHWHYSQGRVSFTLFTAHLPKSAVLDYSGTHRLVARINCCRNFSNFAIAYCSYGFHSLTFVSPYRKSAVMLNLFQHLFCSGFRNKFGMTIGFWLSLLYNCEQ